MALRNKNVEIARYICAFLIVCIHVPLFCSFCIYPILRCAVPFFYILTGFFIYSEDIQKSSSKLRKSLHHYSVLWVTNLVLLSVIVILLRYLAGDNSEFLNSQDFNKFLRLGFCNFLSHVTISDHTYNITNQLWYLYGGAIALFFLYITRSKWFTRKFNILIGLLAIVPIILSYAISVKVPQYVYLSIPSIYLGICVNKYRHRLYGISTMQILTGIFMFVVFVYAEYILSVSLLNRVVACDAYLGTLMLSSLFVIVTLRLPETIKRGGGIPYQASLDIYIWHQLVYVILVGLFEIELYQLDAIVVFVVSMLISIIYRHIKNYYENRNINIPSHP